MRPDYYISRTKLEKLIEASALAVAALLKRKKFSEADHANDTLQALKELHEHNYGRKQ